MCATKTSTQLFKEVLMRALVVFAILGTIALAWLSTPRFEDGSHPQDWPSNKANTDIN